MFRLMIAVLLLPLFLAAGDPAIQLWINNDGRFVPGDYARIQVRTMDSGYLFVLQAAPDGGLRVLFPLAPGDNNFVHGGERYELKGSDGREGFRIDTTSGRGMVYAAVSPQPFRFQDYRQIDDWDYKALAPSPLPPDPESELTELVRRMAPGDFDYDVITYEVIERVVYASDNGSDSSDAFVSEDFFYGGFGAPFFSGCSPFFNPFFQCPFFFDPFFHEPALITRFFRPPFVLGRQGVVSVPFHDRRNNFSQGVRPTPSRAREAMVTNQGSRPVDVSRRRLAPVPLGRRADWPVDVSPRSSELATMARQENWPMDVSPRLRGPNLAIGRRAGSDRAAGLSPQIEPARLSGGRGIADRPALQPVPLGRADWRGLSTPSQPGLSGLPHASPSMGRGLGFGHR